MFLMFLNCLSVSSVPVLILFNSLSKDKKTFLMHDDGKNFLLRTTDVKNKFQDLANGTHTDFTWEELQTLNAGEWFLKVRIKLFFIFIFCV